MKMRLLISYIASLSVCTTVFSWDYTPGYTAPSASAYVPYQSAQQARIPVTLPEIQEHLKALHLPTHVLPTRAELEVTFQKLKTLAMNKWKSLKDAGKDTTAVMSLHQRHKQAYEALLPYVQ